MRGEVLEDIERRILNVEDSRKVPDEQQACNGVNPSVILSGHEHYSYPRLTLCEPTTQQKFAHKDVLVSSYDTKETRIRNGGQAIEDYRSITQFYSNESETNRKTGAEW
eukprot:CAMPEP_0116003682 /NCGR_PEP_ID=MMETSP0321-20121206/185_1 /TAXON_ID=163516 /ORGANISM="Leptocylindrus danicus var. danicus, Strain B650" /LENGTH=108 /DNA_ID=CAMNT_0003471905 /DNA_START=200 /DNA_END=523 /DNA_ORIENTATION=-